MEQSQPRTVSTRTIEIGVNLCVSQFEMMGLEGAEGILITGHLLEYLEQKFGVTFAEIMKSFEADKKLDLPKLRQ